jgi:hypothetical protein
MTNLDGLTSDERVTYAIGRVARLDAELESTGAFVWQVLAGQGRAAWGAPLSLASILTGIRSMVEHSDYPADVVADALSAVGAARAARDARNAAAHWRWVANEDGTAWDPQQITASTKVRTSWDLAKFESVATDLQVANHRLHAISSYVFQIQMLPQHPELSAMIAATLRFTRGEFELRDDGSAHFDS